MIDLEFADIVGRLAEFELPQADLIVGIARGGVVPAALTAEKLGSALRLLQINFRDENNEPHYGQPILLEGFHVPEDIRTVLIVDDVSVTGQTLATARMLFPGLEVTTFVFKGEAEHVLLPEIKECVNWPWAAARPGRGGNSERNNRA